MDQNSPEQESQAEALRAELDLDNPNQWLIDHIKKANAGFSDENTAGTPLTDDEAIEMSRKQLRDLATNRKENLKFINESRAQENEPPISQEDYDKDLKEEFVQAALDELAPTSEHTEPF